MKKIKRRPKLTKKVLRIILAGVALVVLIVALSLVAFSKTVSNDRTNHSGQSQSASGNQSATSVSSGKASAFIIPPTDISNIKKIVPPAKQNKIPSIPVLEYHHIRDFTDKSDGNNYYTSVSPALFQSQMKYLKNAGYRTISWDDYLAGKKTAKSIIITFDDGDEDAYTQAYPVLQNFGFQGVFYVIAGFINQPDYLTADQIKEMSNNGMTIGSHTLDHCDLTKIDQSAVPNELSASKAAIENVIGKPVTNFCYPFGGYNKVIISMVEQAGYLTATSTREAGPGAFQNNLAIPRVTVPPGLGASTLLQRVAGIEGEK